VTRLLAAAGTRRASGAPDLPTVAELGFPGFAIEAWYGLVAPARTPASVIAILDQAMVEALRSDDVRQRLLQHGYEPIGEGSSDIGATIRSDIAKYSSVIKDAGIQGDP
jgi:tripartite-type tricarboxylate transporter receptor subunit TctC